MAMQTKDEIRGGESIPKESVEEQRDALMKRSSPSVKLVGWKSGGKHRFKKGNKNEFEASLRNAVKQLNKNLYELAYINLKHAQKAAEEDESLNFFTRKLLVAQAIQHGLPYNVFTKIQELIPLTLKEWAEYLDISTKSLSRYKSQNISFKPMHSERIFEIVEVSMLGMEVFEDYDKFSLWLDTPNYALANNKPSELLRDSYGKSLVISELTRIDHGIFI